MNGSAIDRSSPTPLYEQVKAWVRTRIGEGVYKPGDPLPSERELCRLLGVSHITVRQALVQLTQERVLFRVQGKGTYVGRDEPSAASSAATVGLVIPESDNYAASPFFLNLMAGVKAVTVEHQAALAIYTETEAGYVVDAASGRVRGLILLAPHVHDRTIPMLARQRLPLVVVGETDEPGVFSVDNDNEAIGAMVAEHLLERGHRRIGYIGGPRHFTVTQARLRGFRRAIRKAGLKPDERLARFGEYGAGTGSRHALDLVELGATALFGADDTIALGALNALHAAGRRVPDEVALAGCNNSDFSRHAWPPLTSVDIQAARLGRSAAEVLMQAMGGRRPEPRTIIEAKLIVRDSSAPGRSDFQVHSVAIGK